MEITIIRYISILLSLLILYPSLLYASNIKFEKLTLEDGLSQSVVLDVVQDSSGFLWIATQDGLNRYDGSEFKIFKYSPLDSSTIPDNWINALAVGNNSTLWIGTFRSGLTRLNLKSYKFTQIVLDSTEHDVTFPITKIIPFQNYLFVATMGNGFFIIDLLQNRIKHFKSNSTTMNYDNVRSAILENEKYLWLGCSNGIFKFNVKTENFIKVFEDELSDNYILSMMQDSNKNLWIGTREGLNIYSISQNKIFTYSNSAQLENNLSDETIVDIHQDSFGFVWVGTWKGGLNKTNLSINSAKFDYSKIQFQVFTHLTNDNSSVSGNYIRKIFEDKSKLLWIGTWGSALSKCNINNPKFYTVTSNKEDKIHTSHSFIRTFTMDKDNRLWVGTAGGGLDIFNPQKNKFINYSFTKKLPNTIATNRVYSLKTDSVGDIWIGLGAGLVKWNSKSNKFIYFDISKDISGVQKQLLINGIEEYDGYMIITSNRGMFAYDRNIDKFLEFKVHINDSLKTLDFQKEITSLFKDRENNFWLGTTKSFLYKFVIKKASEGYLVVEKIDEYNSRIETKYIGRKRVNNIYQDSKGYIWIATSLGLLRFDEGKDKFKVFTENEGLPNDIVYSVLEDNQNNIWASTNKGLAKLTSKSNGYAITHYDISDGLQDNEFNQSSCYKGKDGILYFGGINGYSYFNPEKIRDNSNIPNTVVTKIKLFNKEIRNLNKVLSRKEIVVDYSDKMLTFDFASLEFTNPNKNKYAYKLEGFDDFWINNGNENSATYTNLYPGSYKLKIKSSNNDGIWGKEKLALSVIVNPPFWMTWWFILLAILLITLIIVVVYNYRVNRLLEMERLRTKIASDLHDEVGSLLTQISISADLINYDSNIDKIKGRGSLIRNKSREIMGAMSDVIWSIDARNDKLENLIDRMQDFASSLLDEKDILLDFQKSVHNSNKELKIDLRQNIFLIFKEAINNSVKYSDCTKITVNISYLTKEFTMKISDNGKGMDLTKQYKGNGLKNMKMRADRISGKIKFESKNGLTIFVILNKL